MYIRNSNLALASALHRTLLYALTAQMITQCKYLSKQLFHFNHYFAFICIVFSQNLQKPNSFFTSKSTARKQQLFDLIFTKFCCHSTLKNCKSSSHAIYMYNLKQGASTNRQQIFQQHQRFQLCVIKIPLTSTKMTSVKWRVRVQWPFVCALCSCSMQVMQVVLQLTCST